jgi:hypothetical protein
MSAASTYKATMESAIHPRSKDACSQTAAVNPNATSGVETTNR